MRTLRLALFIIALLTFPSCGTRRLRGELEQLAASPSSLVLYSLEPTPDVSSASLARDRFHEFLILGTAEVRDVAERQALLRELARYASDPGDGVSMCFNPRHGIRVQQAGRSVDLVICFECAWIQPDGLNSGKGFSIDPVAQPLFDMALNRYDLPKSAN